VTNGLDHSPHIHNAETKVWYRTRQGNARARHRNEICCPQRPVTLFQRVAWAGMSGPVTVHFPDASDALARSSVVKVTGTRSDAIAAAHKRINCWLRRQTQERGRELLSMGALWVRFILVMVSTLLDKRGTIVAALHSPVPATEGYVVHPTLRALMQTPASEIFIAKHHPLPRPRSASLRGS
jgi:hypothetical protein